MRLRASDRGRAGEHHLDLHARVRGSPPLYDWLLERLADGGFHRRCRSRSSSRDEPHYVTSSPSCSSWSSQMVDGWNNPRMRPSWACGVGATPRPSSCSPSASRPTRGSTWAHSNRRATSSKASRAIAVSRPAEAGRDELAGRADRDARRRSILVPSWGAAFRSGELWIEREDFAGRRRASSRSRRRRGCATATSSRAPASRRTPTAAWSRSAPVLELSRARPALAATRSGQPSLGRRARRGRPRCACTIACLTSRTRRRRARLSRGAQRRPARGYAKLEPRSPAPRGASSSSARLRRRPRRLEAGRAGVQRVVTLKDSGAADAGAQRQPRHRRTDCLRAVIKVDIGPCPEKI